MRGTDLRCSKQFALLFEELRSNDLSPEARRLRFAALLQTPGGPFVDAALPMIDSVKHLARHVTVSELRKRNLPPAYVHPDDVAHEALLVFMERCHAIREVSKLRSWFWSVMQAKLVKLLGRNLPVVEVSDLDLIEDEPHASIALSTGEDGADTARPRINAVRTAVRELSPCLLPVVVLHVVHGLSHEEIARTLRIKPSTVRVRWLRAKRVLSERLADVA